MTLSLRSLLNFAYLSLAEGRDKDDLAKLDDELETVPGQGAKPRSKGTEKLMALLGGRGR